MKVFDEEDSVAKDSSGNVISNRQEQKVGLWTRIADKLDGVPPGSAQSVAEMYARGYEIYCPDGCRLPEAALQRPSRVIGIAGETGTSKTSVLVSMITKIREDPYLAEHFSIRLSSESADGWDRQSELQFDGRSPTPATTLRIGRDEIDDAPQHYWGNMEQRSPLVVEVTRPNGVGVNLVFVDIAGEESVKLANVASKSPHLAIADQLWFFLTPSVNSDVRTQLLDAAQADAQLKNEYNQSFSRSQQMIHDVAQLWKKANSRPAEASVGSPRLKVLVVLAKADQLTRVRFDNPTINELIARVAPPADWLSSPAVQSDLYSAEGVKDRNDDTRMIVRYLFPQIANSIRVNFPEAEYLPVAATGNPAVASTNGTGTEGPRKYSKVKPYGVVDLFCTAITGLRELGEWR